MNIIEENHSMSSNENNQN
jgi:hypothetical protein